MLIPDLHDIQRRRHSSGRDPGGVRGAGQQETAEAVGCAQSLVAKVITKGSFRTFGDIPDWIINKSSFRSFVDIPDWIKGKAGRRQRGQAGVSPKAKKRGENDSLNLLKRGFSNFKRGGGLTSPYPVCPSISTTD